MSLDSLCSTHAIDVQKFLITKDSSGGAKRVPQDYLSGVSCNIQPLTFKEKILFAQRQILYTQVIYFAYDPNVTRDMLITVTDSPNPEQVGRTYVPLGQADMAGQGRAYRLEVRDQSTP